MMLPLCILAVITFLPTLRALAPAAAGCGPAAEGGTMAEKEAEKTVARITLAKAALW